MLLPNSSFTCLSEAHGSTSWLDHFILSKHLFDSIATRGILYMQNVNSDHIPVSVVLNVDSLPYVNDEIWTNNSHTKISRSNLTTDELEYYRLATEQALKNISINHDVISCVDCTCNDEKHHRYLLFR